MAPQALPSPQGCGEQVLEGGISTVGTMLERFPFGTLQLAGGAFIQIYQDMDHSGHGECIGQCLIWRLLSYELVGSILVSGITDLIKSEPRYCNPSDMWFWYKCISSASQFGLYIVLHNSRDAASSAVTLIYSLTDFSCSTRFSSMIDIYRE